MDKKIRLALGSCAKLEIDMTDEMIRDYQECAREAEQEGAKDCSKCSWDDIQIGDTALCCLLDLEKVLEEKENETRRSD